MTLEFRNGQTTTGALLFITNTSHAWNWTIIGYPFEGMVRLTRTGKSNIDAEFDVVYRCIGYVHRTGEDKAVHQGWEAKPEEECPQNLFPPNISFGFGVDPAHSERPEKLPYTGGTS